MHELNSDTLFISDVHLGGFTHEMNYQIEQNLISLLDYAYEQNLDIIILGDLLDYYMQYGDFVPECGITVFNWFKEYHQKSGKKSLFITGNHDNWDYGFFNTIGFDTEHEYRILMLPTGERVLMMHGDGLKESLFEFPRPWFHRLLRNPYFVGSFKTITTPAFGNSIMRSFSAWSRNNDSHDVSDKAHLDQHAIRLLKANMADIVICGHHHEIRDQYVNQKRYINTGAFFKNSTVCLYTTGSFNLVTWHGAQRIFTPINNESAG